MGTTMGTDFNLPDDPQAVKHTDLRWTLGDPLPPAEAVDLLTLSDDELCAYVHDLRSETTWLRACPTAMGHANVAGEIAKSLLNSRCGWNGTLGRPECRRFAEGGRRKPTDRHCRTHCPWMIGTGPGLLPSLDFGPS